MNFVMEGMNISDAYIDVKHGCADAAELNNRAICWLNRADNEESKIRDKFSGRMLTSQLDNLDAMIWRVDAVRQNTQKIIAKEGR